MRESLRFVALGAVAVLSAACLASPAEGEQQPAPAGARGDSRSITPADLVNATQLSLLDFARAERPHWFRRADGRPAAVTVYLDETLAGGGAAALREVTLSRVALVRYYDITAAQQRYSSRISTPVIAVTTK